MKRFVCLLMIFLMLAVTGCGASAKQEVITFAKAIAVIEQDGETWVMELKVFSQYAEGMMWDARQTKFNELGQQLNSLKQRALDVQRPSTSEARSVHDKYVQVWFKLSEMFAVLSTNDTVRAQSLYDEATLLAKQFYEQMDDLLKKYGLTRSDVGLAK